MSEPNATTTKPTTNGYVDAHVHVWTDDLKRYPLAKGWSKEQMNPRRFTPETLLDHAQAVDVRRIVLIQMIFYGSDNSYMLDCIRQYPGVFAGIAQIDERGNDPGGEMRRLKPLGVRGIRVFPPRRGATDWLDGKGMQAMWTTGAEEGIALCPLVNVDDLPEVDRMCRAYPDTPVVIDHCARIGGDGLFRESDIRQLTGFAKHPNVYVKLSAFYYLGAKRPPYDDVLPMLRRLVDAFGAKRLMWATDCPFQVEPPHTYEASLALIRDRLDFVTPVDRQWILEHTAASLFFT